MSKEYSVKDIISGLIPFITILIIEIFFNICNKGIRFAFHIQLNSIFFIIILSYSIYGMLISIMKKLSTSTIIASTIGFLLLTINQLKLAYTGEPLYFSDINFLTNINHIVGIVENNILIVINYLALKLFILLIIFALIIWWTKKNDVIIENKKTRIILLIISVLILLILFLPNKYTKNVLLRTFLNIDNHTDYKSYTTNYQYYAEHSFFTGMYGVLLNNRFDEPKNYDEKELNNILVSTNEDNETSKWGKPNIIVMFSESFWDLNRQDNVKFNEQITPNINRLKEEGKLIETISCAYGGMSENVAFELLTGGSLNYFTKGYIPIMSLYKKENSENITSIVRELNNNNYKSKIVFGKDYYNSESAMKKIGFDEYVELKETAENKKGTYISDEYITDTIINDFENKEKEKPLFYMVETIQNHVHYDINKYDKYDISIKESNLSEEMNNTILSYAQGVYDADKQLNRLYEYIKSYEEPTILIFLGDHLPYLYTQTGVNVLDYLSYFNTNDELENLYRKYNTQTLVLSNYNIEKEKIPNCLSNYLLLTYIINNLDIKISDYYKWLYSTTDYLPASNSYVSIDGSGNKYSTEKIEGRIKEIYDLRENMQYKFFIEPIE